MAFHDITYTNALRYIIENGEEKPNRTGIDTLGVFSTMMSFDLTGGFPLLTTKKVHWKSVIGELLWFMRGDTNIKWLNDNGITIWDEWADENGDLGPVYGKQWRRWSDGGDRKMTLSAPNASADLSISASVYIDQLRSVVDRIKSDPNDRRLIVSAWNPSEIPSMALPPCHLMYQFYVDSEGYLDCQMYQRSCDMFLGVPFNIASYSALVHIIARITGLKPGRFIWVGGDCHIYTNHFEQVAEQLIRTPKQSPTLVISDDAPYRLDGDWRIEHFKIEGYNPHPPIKAEVAV